MFQSPSSCFPRAVKKDDCGAEKQQRDNQHALKLLQDIWDTEKWHLDLNRAHTTSRKQPKLVYSWSFGAGRGLSDGRLPMCA